MLKSISVLLILQIRKKTSPLFKVFAANYDINQEKNLCGLSGQWIKPLNLKPLAALISKVRSFESSEFMPTVVAAVLSPVPACSSSWREKKGLLLRLD